MDDLNKRLEVLERSLARERAARKQAESILEEKSLALFKISEDLKSSNQQLQELLEQKNIELQGVFTNILDAYVVIDLRGRILKMNDAAKALFAAESKEGFRIIDCILPAYRSHALASFKTLIHQGSFTNYVTQVVSKDGKERTVQVNASIIVNSKGKAIAAQGIARDITAERKAARALTESEKRLATIVQNLNQGILIEDENRNVLLVNDGFCELFDLDTTPNTLTNTSAQELHQRIAQLSDKPEVYKVLESKFVNARIPETGEPLLLKDGRHFEYSFLPITVDEHHKGQMWSFSDVTLEQNYQRGLRAQKDKYSSIIANMNLGLLEVDTQDRVLMANHSFCEMSGYSESELLGMQPSKILLSTESKKIFQKHHEQREQGESDSYELKVKIKNGETRHWLISGAPNYNVMGELTGSIGIHLDITELKRLEKQKEVLLRDLEKRNQQLNEYAHIVSHDLKSPLHNVSALISWTRDDIQNHALEAAQDNLILMQETIEKMDSLIRGILQYSSISNLGENKKTVALSRVLKDLLQMLFIPENITISYPDHLPSVRADATHLQQLFQNLIGNAINHMDKEDGRIIIDCLENKNTVQFSISDNGMGIKEEHFHKIFEIFSSLSKTKNSTGIGLSIVKKIVELYGGKIWLESKLGEGTTFYFTLKK